MSFLDEYVKGSHRKDIEVKDDGVYITIKVPKPYEQKFLKTIDIIEN